MVTREELKGQWNEVKGRLQEHWGQLTDDDLRKALGSTEQLVGVVQQKTGATRREIERILAEAVSEGHSKLDQMSEQAAQYAEHAALYADEASRAARQQYARAAEATADFSRQVTHTVRSRPAESLAIAFGLGLAAGALLFLGRRR